MFYNSSDLNLVLRVNTYRIKEIILIINKLAIDFKDLIIIVKDLF